MTRVLFATIYEPRPSGHGGIHRSYQLLHDLQQVVGSENVQVVDFSEWMRANPRRVSSDPFRKRLEPRLKKRLEIWRSIQENPFSLFFQSEFSIHDYANPRFAEYYQLLITQSPKPDVCVVENVGLSDVLEINRQLDISTILCPQNLESLDKAPPELEPWAIRKVTYDLANELRVLQAADACCMISKVETGLISGLGIDAHFYPYVPKGEIVTQLLEVRGKRRNASQEEGLFLLIGSASHPTSREAFEWFILHAQQYGLPDGVRIVIGGNKTDKYLGSHSPLPQIEIRGWIEQEELDLLLIQAQGFLIPQFRGFGAVTRMIEMFIANIPALASHHVGYTQDVPPNTTLVGDNWDAWCAAMEELMSSLKPASYLISDWSLPNADILRKLILELA